MKKKFFEGLSTTQKIMLSFFLAIFVGSLLLALPISSAGGKAVSYMDALFTATTSICVTGLVTVPTVSTWSLFGQVVILILIQMGGLGIVTIMTGAMITLHKKIGIGDRMLIQDAFNLNTLSGLVKFIKRVLIGTFIVEGIGALLYMTVFVPEYGKKGIWISIFNSISAFCNAGFDLIGNFQSFTGFQSNVVLNICFILLIVIGGLGFTVIDDLLHKRSWKRLTLHSKIVLVVNAILLALGTMLIWALEHNNSATIGTVSTGQQWLASLFQSVSLRTAGFNTIDLASLNNATLFFMMGMMFVGASPTSTGGGVKTTTFAVLLASTFALLRDKKDVVMFKRRIETNVINKSLAVFLLAISWITMAVFLLLVLDNNNHPFQFILFEVFSAMGTVGMGIGITPDWNPWCKLVLIMTMYIGRIGILTFGMSFFNKKVDKLRYPTENVMIG